MKIVNLQQESIELEAQLDDQEDVCDEIWAEKLAYEQSIEELLRERELLCQLTYHEHLKCNRNDADSYHLISFLFSVAINNLSYIFAY